MKTLLALAVAFAVPSLAVACPKGSEPYNGNCVVDIQPEKDNTPSVKPVSNEAPPRDKMPSYEREGIHADMGTRAKEPEVPVAQDAKAEALQR